MVVRVVAFILAVIAGYWFGHDQTWEAFVTTAFLVLTYLGAETFGHYRSDKKVAADRELFAQLKQTLPFDGTIRFLRDHDLCEAFNRSTLADLRRFVEIWIDQSHRFHDRRIERARESFRKTAKEFLGDLAINTWPEDVDDYQAIPKEWRREQPDRYQEVGERLNRRADEVVEGYEKLVQVGRKRLHV